ncbi:cation:proton antiporter domain-containing protein [Halarcobacter anaerophilus]|uniref:Potassium transporter n=1 Tax=Halarcobacter anaerophilus TaxID=877500 RepID=A0A4Q0Y1V6_9BACT|nr:cation:proton antiporter [Halarcobacter anaerophilus]QDF30068.1 glutathione-regulated potassium-efflux system protein, KefB/KefC family [Halarcobacter anaerophilus]RXJ63114.1 potassium transporter [Halarcobacter anaerophilus]
METILFIIFLSFALSTLINIILKKFSMSHIIGYIITGTIITSLFDLNGTSDLHILDLIAEFGIVFLMFTIGLEMPINKLKKMKEILFVNGSIQVGVSAVIIYLLAKYIFDIDTTSSIIIALAFSLSSTAIVLTYLKQSKDIHTPYGEKSTAILVFQDLAVIPILLLISFLSNDTLSLGEILTNTFLSALLIILFMFTIGKKILNWFLDFSSRTRIEELFLASILSIVIGTSLLAHQLGFTYSLGAFIAGMIISETNYHIKVESDISSYKDLLLGAFFFSVGTKIDVPYLLSNIHYVFLIFFGVMVIKAVVIYLLMLAKSNKSDSVKSALALCQIGEFSFAVFALAANDNILDKDLASFLILVTVLSMILTPFIVNNIYKIASFFVVEFYESDKITPINRRNHTIICGYAILGRIIAHELNKQNKSFVIISDNLKHVLLARKNGFMAYFGHLEKLPVLESLKVDEASNIIVTTNSLIKKRLICEAVLNFKNDANLIVRIDSLDEKKELKDLNIKYYVHSQIETAKLMVEKSLSFSS